ncbi:MAG: xanthine dehydrogenase family protein subunit M [Rhodospirillales bacterium]|nr:xanthine dehydrogenase family protein subunit M [Rhodospirillales bacterium]
MTQFGYSAPTSLEDAVRALAGAGGAAKLLSGGTDLLVQIRSGRLQPDLVLDLKRVPGLAGIRRDADGGFIIGAATPLAEIGEHAALRAAWPGVVEAAMLIGSTQVRGRATLAGNLCNASPAADSVPALIAAAANVTVVGAAGRREMAVADVVVAPGRTALGRDELVHSFHLPPRPARAADAYLRLTPRTEMDIAVVGCGVNLQLAADGSVAAARMVLGAVAPTALLVPQAGAALVGRRLDEATLAALAAAVRAACRPIDDKRGTAAYRTKVAGVLARRATALAYARAESRP